MMTQNSINFSSEVLTNDRAVYRSQSFTIYTSAVGAEQFYLVASVNEKDADSIAVCRDIYFQIADIIKQTGIQIIQEKIFGSISVQKNILKERENVLRDCGVYEELPITYIQGKPFWGEGFSGLQVCAVKLSQPQDKIWTIYEDGVPCGRGMKRNGTIYLSLQNIHGFLENNSNNSRAEQVSRMFDKTDSLLRKYGAVYKDVICTRIYISDILDWYKEFNCVRNKKYTEFGIIPTKPEKLITEQIYLPASTGIQADNPAGAAAVMNVLAIVKGADSQLEIEHNNGSKQKSAYRYGSAFSRSAVIREPNNKCILVSGTAAIDEQGISLFSANPHEQMRKTFEIVDALINKEGATLKDICHATVFLKRQEDITIYREIAKEYGLEDLPAVYMVADVCRDELLFEIDAIVAIENID
jgi:enamine deaminase RidA (YjgF/YER057c/UK114 family)